MPTELFWLTLTSLFTLSLSLPYAYVRISRIGLKQLFLNPLPGDDPFEVAWAHRAYRAHMNAMENLVVFAPLALAIPVTDSSSALTQVACAVFFGARLVHAPSYILNIPVVRTVVFFVGWLACFVLGFAILL